MGSLGELQSLSPFPMGNIHIKSREMLSLYEALLAKFQVKSSKQLAARLEIPAPTLSLLLRGNRLSQRVEAKLKQKIEESLLRRWVEAIDIERGMDKDASCQLAFSLDVALVETESMKIYSLERMGLDELLLVEKVLRKGRIISFPINEELPEGMFSLSSNCVVVKDGMVNVAIILFRDGQFVLTTLN